MARAVSPETIAAVASKATLLLDNDHSEYDGVPSSWDSKGLSAARKRARETSPFQPSKIVFADLHGFDEPPKRVLVWQLELAYSERLCEYVDHIVGFVEKKNGEWGVMPRHVKRGEITRGYEKARKLGLLPPAEPESEEPAQ